MIKAVIFDYFGVICSDYYWSLANKDNNDWENNAEFLNLANRVNLGSIHWQEFITYVANKVNKKPSEVENMYQKEGINPRVITLIKQLQKHGYKTGLLTNAHHEFLVPVLKSTGIDHLFNAVIISSKVGLIKPDLRIFELMLEKLNIRPDETIFIDDIIRNVEAANNIGIKGIHYQNYQQLKIELDKLL